MSQEIMPFHMSFQSRHLAIILDPSQLNVWYLYGVDSVSCLISLSTYYNKYVIEKKLTLVGKNTALYCLGGDGNCNLSPQSK